jgi:hypothetical protein
VRRRRSVDEEIGELAHPDDRLHLPARVRRVAKQADADRIVISRPSDGVAVGRSGRDHAAGGDAAGAGLVLHDHRHAEALRQLVGEDPQCHVGRRSGGKRRHDADRLGRIEIRGRCAFAQKRSRESDPRQAHRDEHASEARPAKHGFQRSPCAAHAFILFLFVRSSRATADRREHTTTSAPPKRSVTKTYGACHSGRFRSFPLYGTVSIYPWLRASFWFFHLPLVSG